MLARDAPVNTAALCRVSYSVVSWRKRQRKSGDQHDALLHCWVRVRVRPDLVPFSIVGALSVFRFCLRSGLSNGHGWLGLEFKIRIGDSFHTIVGDGGDYFPTMVCDDPDYRCMHGGGIGHA